LQAHRRTIGDLHHPHILWSPEPVSRTVNQEGPDCGSLRRRIAARCRAMACPSAESPVLAIAVFSSAGVGMAAQKSHSGIWSMVARVKSTALAQMSATGGGSIEIETIVLT
ncbi:hypothetical protein, partial [Gordonia sp. NPDC003429]